jgi:hypothetical protein
VHIYIPVDMHSVRSVQVCTTTMFSDLPCSTLRSHVVSTYCSSECRQTDMCWWRNALTWENCVNAEPNFRGLLLKLGWIWSQTVVVSGDVWNVTATDVVTSVDWRRLVIWSVTVTQTALKHPVATSHETQRGCTTTDSPLMKCYGRTVFGVMFVKKRTAVMGLNREFCGLT